MGGITNYYHGETATVSDIFWRVGDPLTYTLQLERNPHRTEAHDYGTDIGIDPGIKVGDDVIYLRLDDTCGIWVDGSVGSADELASSIFRVERNRRLMDPGEPRTD